MALRDPIRLTQNTGHRITSAPAEFPIDLIYMRSLLRDPPVDDNAFIEQTIEEASYLFEAITGINCVDQSWQMVLDTWPGLDTDWWDGVVQMPVTELNRGRLSRIISLPRYPLQSVDTITVYQEDDTSSTITIPDVFIVDTDGFPGRLVLRAGQTWPVALRRANAIEIDYTAGFGAASNVPAVLKRAVAQIAAFLYEHRGDGCNPQEAFVRSGARNLAAPYMTTRI